jgi:His-Xaa-Ser system protein HxsD
MVAPGVVVEEGKIIFRRDKKIYQESAILKALYWYSEKCFTNITTDDKHFIIEVTPKGIGKNNAEFDLTALAEKIDQDIVDFQLRDIIRKETQNIRDLLVAKAFSNGEFDEPPVGEISDPVGFTVKKN